MGMIRILDAIVKVKIHGRISQGTMAVLQAAALRALAPPTMNIQIAKSLKGWLGPPHAGKLQRRSSRA